MTSFQEFLQKKAEDKGLDPGLIEEVNQVRRYRNWVAHGRRGVQPDYVSPEIAFDRLGRFLERLQTNQSPGTPGS